MRDARIQTSKLNCAILHILSVTIPDIFPVFFRQFGSICAYLSIHLFLSVTLNFIMNFILAEECNLFWGFEKTLLSVGEGIKFYYQLKKYSSRNSTVIYSIGLALAEQCIHTLDSATGQTIFYLASGCLRKDLMACECRWNKERKLIVSK